MPQIFNKAHDLAISNAGIIVGSKDVTGKLNLVPILPTLSGTPIQFTIKTNKEFLKFPCGESVVQ